MRRDGRGEEFFLRGGGACYREDVRGKGVLGGGFEVGKRSVCCRESFWVVGGSDV